MLEMKEEGVAGVYFTFVHCDPWFVAWLVSQTGFRHPTAVRSVGNVRNCERNVSSLN